MNRALPLALLAMCSSHALAADFGVGVSVQSNDAWIYAPIEVTPRFRIEPSIRLFSAESESQTQSSLGLPITTTVNLDSEQRELAVGLFGKTSIGESVRLYYGARAVYIDTEINLRIATRFGTSDEDVQEEKSSLDGYRISPTLGFEYLINEHFSLGGEAEWFYQDLDADISRTNVPAGTETSKSNGTATRLIVRFMF